MEVADLNSLAIFAKVVEAKGFSEAARRLKIPISTVLVGAPSPDRVLSLSRMAGIRPLVRF